MKKLNLTEGMCSANSNATSQFQCHSLTCVGLMNEAVSKSLQEAMFSDKSRTTCQSQCHGPTCVDLISKAGLAHIYIYIYIYIYICVYIYIYRERETTRLFNYWFLQLFMSECSTSALCTYPIRFGENWTLQISRIGFFKRWAFWISRIRLFKNWALQLSKICFFQKEGFANVQDPILHLLCRYPELGASNTGLCRYLRSEFSEACR